MKLNNELETPLFSAVLSQKRIRDDQFRQPSACMSAAVLLKNRSPCMNAIQLLNAALKLWVGY